MYIDIKAVDKFVGWVCECGTAFHYPDHNFPSKLWDEHTETCHSYKKWMQDAINGIAKKGSRFGTYLIGIGVTYRRTWHSPPWRHGP